MTITEFLLARIAEDELKIEYIRREKVRVYTAPIFAANPPDWLTSVDLFVSPDRWAAECAAKRRILALHNDPQGNWCESCGGCDADDYYMPWVPVAYPCETLRKTAAVYADHPDYNPAWAL